MSALYCQPVPLDPASSAADPGGRPSRAAGREDEISLPQAIDLVRRQVESLDEAAHRLQRLAGLTALADFSLHIAENERFMEREQLTQKLATIARQSYLGQRLFSPGHWIVGLAQDNKLILPRVFAAADAFSALGENLLSADMALALQQIRRAQKRIELDRFMLREILLRLSFVGNELEQLDEELDCPDL